MNVKLDDSWKKHLNHHINSEGFKNLVHFVKSEYKDNICYPKGSLIFSALNNCKFNDVKLVILGQDPYHNPNQANGLAFSVPENTTHPPSLINIFKEIEQDLNVEYPLSGDLMPWVNQGVLLLNSTLTVRKNRPGSHQNVGWEDFTDEIINLISVKKNNIVFFLWGNYAKRKSKLINQNKHLILSSGHPSPLSANRGYWFGNKHFSKANQYLKEINNNGNTILVATHDFELLKKYGNRFMKCTNGNIEFIEKKNLRKSRPYEKEDKQWALKQKTDLKQHLMS